ncbi:hypothetical protein Clacol_007170 [Clathrus columnatus]|uniref:Uncharacterized protein n=1 Tax=Clathrus columnatus TaxID=1419009 RepID=A0AAV5AII1_9AGAM|nr:hypothetical protein Clacol_007170 [Clathrus columnatus]
MSKKDPRRSGKCQSSARKIRVDLKTPRPNLKEIVDDNDSDSPSPPSEAKRLEEKVARAAASKCSFEEVSELHKEIQQWLASEVKRTSASQHASLQLSAALLRAILLNCLAYSEASKAAKSVETSLKEKLDSTLVMKEHLEVERTMYGQKVRECQDLRSELNRLKLATPVPASSIPRPSAPPPPPSIPRVSATPGPLSRMNTLASRASAMTPPPVPVTRQPYHPRSASTAPTATAHSRGMSTSSIPSSNTMVSALKYQSSPLKPRVVASRSSSPPLIDESNPPQRWLPTSDDESSNERRFQSPSPERVFRSTTERISTASSSQARWYPRFHQPQDVV